MGNDSWPARCCDKSVAICRSKVGLRDAYLCSLCELVLLGMMLELAHKKLKNIVASMALHINLAVPSFAH